MSSDLSSGKNKKFTKESVYIMLSEKLGKLFYNKTAYDYSYRIKNDGLNKEFFYNYFLSNNKFSVDEERSNNLKKWDLYARYELSNNYTENMFDNVVILNAAVESEQYLDLLDKKDETIEERKSIILNSCKEKIDNGLCSNFSLTGLFPHLDKPNSIVDLKSISGDIPCFEYGYTTIYAEIDYTDSCGMNLIQPEPGYTDFKVSYYPSSVIYGPTWYPYGVSGIINEKFLYNTLNDGKKQDSVYEWEITENSVDVMVKNDLYTSNTIEIATLSSAINPTITLNLTYTE